MLPRKLAPLGIFGKAVKDEHILRDGRSRGNLSPAASRSQRSAAQTCSAEKSTQGSLKAEGFNEVKTQHQYDFQAGFSGCISGKIPHTSPAQNGKIPTFFRLPQPALLGSLKIPFNPNSSQTKHHVPFSQ